MCSGALAASVLQPFDVLRTQMQAGSLPMTLGQTLRSTVRAGGVPELWRGAQAGVTRVGIGVGLHMTVLEALKARLAAPGGELSWYAAMVSAGAGRAVANVVMCPVTVVKTRVEFGGEIIPRGLNVFQAMAFVARKEGVRGLYRGLGSGLASSVPFSALYYAFYTQLQDRLGARGGLGQAHQPAVNFVAGVTAAAGATLLTQPFDVLRTRAQLATGSVLRNPIASAAAMLRREGPRAFLAGTTPRFLKRTLQTALVWTVYEIIRDAGQAQPAAVAAAKKRAAAEQKPQ